MANKINIKSIAAKLKKKCAKFDIYSSESSSESVVFENNKLFMFENNFGAGIGMRVFKNGQTGFSFTSNPDKINQTIDYAIDSAAFGEKINIQLPKAATAKIKQPKIFDQNIIGLDLKSCVPLGKKIIAKIMNNIPNSMISLDFSKQTGADILLNSNDCKVTEKSTSFSFSVSVVEADKKNGLLDIYGSRSSCALLSTAEINKITDELIERYHLAKKIVKIKAGAYPVIFNKYSVGALYSSFLQAINGKTFQKGISPLSNKINTQITDSRFSMYDDPTIDYSIVSFAIDGEGIPAYKKPLIENGVFKNFIFDLRTAALTGNKSTGNAGRSYASQPQPSFSNIVVEPGDVAYSDMIKNIDEGLLVEHTIGGGQSNVLAGDFSVNVSLGYWIKKGKIVGRVKDCMIAGNVYDLFNRINSISKEIFVKSSLHTPAICFDKVNISI